MQAPCITTKCATCPISSGCGGNPYAEGRCLRGDDLAEIAALRTALSRMVSAFKPFTLRPVGGAGSQARFEQDEQIRAHAEAVALSSQEHKT